jgi:hypothetical protein
VGQRDDPVEPRRGPVDLNHGHLAAWAVTPDGNPAGPPLTIPVALSGLSASQRDGRLRAAISAVIALARQRGCQAIVIEDLDFAAAREQGRERHGGRPSRGARGRRYRALVSGIPTGRCPAGSIRTVIPAQPRCVSGKLDQITASQGNLARRPVAESSHGPRRRLATGAPPANAASS